MILEKQSKKNIRLPELLAPAGNFEKLVTAIHYGADAVYLGGRNYSLRARAGNFDAQGMRRAVAYAHEHGVRVYVTVNIFAHNRDFAGLADHLRFLAGIGVDGLIIADPGILLTARETVPDMALHLSTQANVTNAASARFWAMQGVQRLNLARELGIGEIKRIRDATEVELEIFVHGALCISYSGRCLLSSYLTGRDANQGDCAHPCRYSYHLVEEKRPGQYFPVEEDGRGTYIFNSQDLCLLSRLPELVETGIDSIKIEGRMKSMGYVGSVVRVYRAALDWIGSRLQGGEDPREIVLPHNFTEEIEKTGTRGQTQNFFDSRPSAEAMLYDTMRTAQKFAPVGIVRGIRPLEIETRNVLKTSDRIEYLGRGMETVSCIVTGMIDARGEELDRANPGSRVILQTEPELKQAELHGILRKDLNR
ncbi:peptidase U32 family protein [Desulfolithobacter sp.]